MIELRHVRMEFGNLVPLKDINTVINDGDTISVIGPSGTGKSTLLRCINLLHRPTSGEILLNGEEITAKGYDISKARQRMGMVFQSFNLFDHLTVIENVMAPQVDLLHRPNQEAYDNGMRLLKQVGMKEWAMKYPKALSGGQKQRVAIARTLSMDPEIILFDEPTSALDPTMVGEVQAVIEELSRSGKTMMIVTHEMAFARSICNRVFYIDEGVIYEEGTPEEIFEHPKNEKTRWFVKRLKVLELMINDKDFDFSLLSSEMDHFCTKNGIPLRTGYRIRSVIEELCQQILLPEYDDPRIKIVVEYSAKENAPFITVTYNGKQFNPFESENEIAVKVLRGVTESDEYTYDEKEKTNNINITVRSQ